MSLQYIKRIFEELSNSRNLSLQVLQITTSKRNGTTYKGRVITLQPQGRIREFAEEIKEKYVGSKGCFDMLFSNYMEYDGSANGKTIYRLSKDMALISDEYDNLMNAILNPDYEMNPFDLKLRATVLSCIVKLDDEDVSVKLITMQNPITVLARKFYYKDGSFKELNDKVLSLKASVDVMIAGNEIYFLTLAGENLFNMERSYKAVSVECIAKIGESEIIVDFETFSSVASSGHNPRRFVAYNSANLEKLKNNQTRKRIANKFSIPLSDGKLDASNPINADRIVKILCNKGMISPFDDAAMEVSSARKWE